VAQLAALAETLGNGIGLLLVDRGIQRGEGGPGLHLEPSGLFCVPGQSHPHARCNSEQETGAKYHGNILLMVSAWRATANYFFRLLSGQIIGRIMHLWFSEASGKRLASVSTRVCEKLGKVERVSKARMRWQMHLASGRACVARGKCPFYQPTQILEHFYLAKSFAEEEFHAPERFAFYDDFLG
jgi:hypothetical protein